MDLDYQKMNTTYVVIMFDLVTYITLVLTYTKPKIRQSYLKILLYHSEAICCEKNKIAKTIENDNTPSCFNENDNAYKKGPILIHEWK